MLAIIGGTGLSRLTGFTVTGSQSVDTPYADTALEVTKLDLDGTPFLFLPRHGETHALPPHRVNYRANIKALAEAGASAIVAVNAVGGIHPQMEPGSFMVPDQLIDYTHSRRGTFFEDDLQQVTHIDFTLPFSQTVREALLQAAAHANSDSGPETRTVLDGGVYGVTQGPRLETAAEIRRLQQDGCDIVGMTAMPEAALARELALPYGMLALSVNWAAGLFPGEITMAQIEAVLSEGMDFVGKVLRYYIRGT